MLTDISCSPDLFSHLKLQPIRDPPTGKKYVRCPCNCLLICKATAGRIACPRISCKRIINTNKQNDPNADSSLFREGNNLRTGGSQPPTSSATSSSPGMCRVMCGHCSDSFMFNSLTNSLARCPFCRKLSSVGPDFARYRGIVSLVLFLILTVIGSLVIYFTLDQHQLALNVLYFGIFSIAGIFMFRSFYYLTMKVSFIESQAENPI